MPSSPKRTYSANTNRSPSANSSSLEQADSGMDCSAASSSYTSGTNLYNNGYVNYDPIVGHNPSLINAHLTYRLLNNGPLIIESKIWNIII